MKIRSGLLFIAWIAGFLLCSCSASRNYDDMRSELNDFVNDKDAEIGVAVIIDGKDTVAVNGDRQFPMLSVYKFPISLALADVYRKNGISFDTPVEFGKDDLHPDTYSPMTGKLLAQGELPVDTMTMPARELLAYMLQQSDNNASDIMLREAGGADAVQDYLSGIGIGGVNVRSSENEMHADNSLCYINSATPIAMAELLDRFDRCFTDSVSVEIKRIMESCGTGVDRLAKPLMEVNAEIGHKTGTGFMLPDGRIMAVNDAGYVHLPDGTRYSIAVFVENSRYDMAATEALIAEISSIVLKHINGK